MKLTKFFKKPSQEDFNLEMAKYWSNAYNHALLNRELPTLSKLYAEKANHYRELVYLDLLRQVELGMVRAEEENRFQSS